MRFIRHLLAALLIAIVVLIAAVAFALYDPLAGGPRFLKLSQMITSPRTTIPAQLPGGDRPVEQTDPPALAALALRYQPTLVVSGFDRMWPVSVLGLLRARWHGRTSCMYLSGACRIEDPTAAAFAKRGARSDWIQFPTPVDSVQDAFLSAAADFGMPQSLLHDWSSDMQQRDPFASAQIYFYYLPKAPRDAYPGVPHGLVSLEYWFYYPLNYFPLIRIPLEAFSNPIGSTLGNTDLHQGDLEHVAVLLDPKTMQPLYLWMARHSDEGQAYKWHSSGVQWQGDHPVIYAALGSHASYAHCGIQRRSLTYLFINDYVVCIPHKTYAFTYSATPLVDLASTPWGCWRGHLGEAGPRLQVGQVGFVPYETPGPYSPLMQQENFPEACSVPPGTPKPVPEL